MKEDFFCSYKKTSMKNLEVEEGVLVSDFCENLTRKNWKMKKLKKKQTIPTVSFFSSSFFSLNKVYAVIGKSSIKRGSSKCSAFKSG